MAEDLHKEGFEEDKKQSSGSKDDDDFGLPDLEFEELEELDLDLDDDSSDNTDSNVSALDEGIDEVEDVMDSAQLISDRLGEDSDDDESSDETNDDDMSVLDSIDMNSDDNVDNQDDSLNEISSPDELAALGMADEDEEESSTESLFAADDSEPSESDVFGNDSDFDGGSIFASDDISLKQEEKMEFESAEDAELPPTYKPYSDDESKGGFAKVIIFGAIGFTLVGFIFYYFFTQDIGVGSEKSEKKVEQVASTKKPEVKPVAESKDGGEKTAETAGEKDSKSNTTTPAKTTTKPAATKSSTSKASPKPGSNAPAGEIVEIQSKTGRSYIIIGSFIDQDLANDYAKELSASGKGVKVIFPFGKSKRYRVSVVDFDSYADAMAQIGSYKSTYGEDIWTLKY
ncbi:SPOR domain-containing protein [Reichenbachiella sp. MALMAid0571]|uniref:SPOR domain-containing protein n=1 Tax=Reichenbachiella sp. MALMAid0571 TaxID=3143939 RepID=UPI0032DEBC4C